MSATLGRSVALGMIERGAELARAGAMVEIFDRGQTMRATVCPPCFYDTKGERLRG
jgi:glycine cleavage system aminomethyltransferase T